MRIYANPMEMIKEVERDLFEMGTRYQTATVQDEDVATDPDFETIELYAYAYTLIVEDDPKKDPIELAKFSGYSKDRISWIGGESNERLLGPRSGNLNPGRAWENDGEFWSKYLRDDKFSYSYTERWQEQLPYIIWELKNRPNTRQAVMTMYDRHQDMMNWGGRDRVPCSLTYQFMIRDGKLNLVYNQRSCDFMKFFAADVIFTIDLLNWVSTVLDIPSGNFTHFIGSLHAFAGDLKGRNIF